MSAPVDRISEEIRIELGASDILNASVRRVALEAAMRAVTPFLDHYAHELAEKIRAQDVSEPDDYRKPQAWREGYSEGVQEVADLIDPEVSHDDE